MIDSADISIVFQGPLAHERGVAGAFTARAVKAARQIFSMAQIIVSTWEGEPPVDLSDADVIVVSRAPEAIPFDDNSTKLNNINRMILSTQRGLELVDRPYTLKLRTDCELHGNHVIALWERLARQPRFARIFGRQVGAYPVYTMSFEERFGTNRMPKPFHVSDWCFFGHSNDVSRIFSHPQVEEPYYSRYFDYPNAFSNVFDTLPSVKWRYSPEQYLTYSTFKKFFADTPRFENKRHYTLENIGFSHRAVRENFLVFDQGQWNCSFEKDFYNKSLYTFDSNCYRGLRQHGAYIAKDLAYFVTHAPFSTLAAATRNILNDFRHAAREAGSAYKGVFRRFAPLSPLPPLPSDRQGVTLAPGEELKAGKALLSPSGNSVLEFDGLHVRIITKERGSDDFCSSHFALPEPAEWLTLQEDGALAAYADGGLKVWEVATGCDGAVLTLLDDGDLFLALGAKRLWSLTEVENLRSSSSDTFVAWLAPGDILQRGGQLRSISGRAIAELCPLGLRVIASASTAAEVVLRTQSAPERLVVRQDGSVAILGPQNETLWQSQSGGSGSYIEIGDQGELGLFSRTGVQVLQLSAGSAFEKTLFEQNRCNEGEGSDSPVR